MWICSTCHEQHADTFVVCWNCGTDMQGRRDPEFDVAEPEDREADVQGDPDDLTVRYLPDLDEVSLVHTDLLWSVRVILRGLDHRVPLSKRGVGRGPLSAVLSNGSKP
jgi:hypothetical protein